MRIIQTILVTLGIMLSLQSFAQDRQRPTPEQIFEQLDTNKDNKISKEEAEKAERGPLKKDFDQIDTNDDGYIDEGELKAFGKNRRGGGRR